MTPGERLNQARRDAGFESAKAAAEAMGVSVATYIQHENGSRGITRDRAAKYGQFLRVAPEWILYGRGGKDATTDLPGLRRVDRFVPVLGTVQAGAWTELREDTGEPEEVLPVSLPGYEGATLYVLNVRGTSMDKVFADGSRVVVCPAAEIGIRVGNYVVVRRRRGLLIETTLKEVVQAKGGIELWPRSNDPAHQVPIKLSLVRDADEGPEIIAVVVAAYSVLPQPNRPLLQL